MISWSLIRQRVVPRRADIIAATLAVFVGFVAGSGVILWSNRSNSVITYSAYELDGIAPRSGSLDLVFAIDRIRECPTQTSRWLWTWVNRNGDRIRHYFPLLSSEASVTSIGDNQHFILSLPLPSGIWPGNWYYTSKIIERCPLLFGLTNTQILTTPAIPIQIVAGP